MIETFFFYLSTFEKIAKERASACASTPLCCSWWIKHLAKKWDFPGEKKKKALVERSYHNQPKERHDIKIIIHLSDRIIKHNFVGAICIRKYILLSCSHVASYMSSQN